MKPHEHLYLSMHTAMGKEEIEKVLKYLTTHLFNLHPRTMEDDVTCCHFCVAFFKFIWSFQTQVVHLKNTFLVSQSHQDVYKMSVHT